MLKSLTADSGLCSNALAYESANAAFALAFAFDSPVMAAFALVFAFAFDSFAFGQEQAKWSMRVKIKYCQLM